MMDLQATDALAFAPDDASAKPLWLLSPQDLERWAGELDPVARAWAEAMGFEAKAGQCVVLPDAEGAPQGAAFGLGPEGGRARFTLAQVRAALPGGTWRLVGALEGDALAEAALGWLLGGYVFDRYASARPPRARLKAPDGVDAHRLAAIAGGEALTRDLINTPARDMGPADLEAAARDLAERCGMSCEVTHGDALECGFPLIHAVGAAAAPERSARLIDLNWGPEDAPKVTLVGKGVCFDTGGLNLKPASSMGLMKKDMGGAATVLGLARMICALDLPLRLRVLIPAVENAVSGAAFRPGDILRARDGKSIEVNNTDAEGRLVLADALSYGGEAAPDTMVCMATLTGAARVALGPDIAPFYTDDDDLARDLAAASERVRDPLWRMPFWAPYESMIEPGIADLDNAPAGGFAGSITAALFLRRFADGAGRFVHFDIYGWQPKPQPARPKGGVGQGARALLEVLSPQ